LLLLFGWLLVVSRSIFEKPVEASLWEPLQTAAAISLTLAVIVGVYAQFESLNKPAFTGNLQTSRKSFLKQLKWRGEAILEGNKYQGRAEFTLLAKRTQKGNILLVEGWPYGRGLDKNPVFKFAVLRFDEFVSLFQGKAYVSSHPGTTKMVLETIMEWAVSPNHKFEVLARGREESLETVFARVQSL
jgi:hypothetical protein